MDNRSKLKGTVYDYHIHVNEQREGSAPMGRASRIQKEEVNEEAQGAEQEANVKG